MRPDDRLSPDYIHGSVLYLCEITIYNTMGRRRRCGTGSNVGGEMERESGCRSVNVTTGTIVLPGVMRRNTLSTECKVHIYHSPTQHVKHT